jgi:hypothetical protein
MELEGALEAGGMDLVGMAFHAHQPLGQLVQRAPLRATSRSSGIASADARGIDDDRRHVLHFRVEARVTS